MYDLCIFYVEMCICFGAPFAFLFVFVCAGTCMCGCPCMCACVCGGQRTTLSVSHQEHDFFLKSGCFFFFVQKLYYFNKHICMHVYAQVNGMCMWVQFLWRPEEGFKYSGSWSYRWSWATWCRCWESNFHLLWELYIPLTAETLP